MSKRKIVIKTSFDILVVAVRTPEYPVGGDPLHAEGIGLVL